MGEFFDPAGDTRISGENHKNSPEIKKLRSRFSRYRLIFSCRNIYSNSVLISLALLLLVSLDPVWGSPCVCGVDRVPCGKNLTSTDCPNGRVISRRDCTCCFVCAKQLTEECNNLDKLCDSDYGLECGVEKRCKAKTQCSDDTSCSSDLMCVGGACADPCKVLPDVCLEAGMKKGICVSRNHRAMCTCPPGTLVNSEKECDTSVQTTQAPEEAKKCTSDSRHLSPGDTIYQQKCLKSCTCLPSGALECHDLPKNSPPDCSTRPRFIPMSTITGEMTEACKILVGNDTLFDGCCVPEKCQNVKSQDSDSKGRDFKLTESHNNLGEDDKSKLKLEDDGLHSGTISETKMQVTVSKRSDKSAVISLPNLDKEAMLSIALSKELMKNPGSSEVWKEHRIPAGLPQITLSDLKPNTSYTLKYKVEGKEYPSVQFITDDSVKKSSSTEMGSLEIHDSSEMSRKPNDKGSEEMSSSSIENMSGTSSMEMDMETTSHPHPESSVGCLYNHTSYETGDIFHVGCDERCECMKNGEVKCMERCSIPLFKKGAFAHDKFCFEEPSGIDECCVIVACARANPDAHSRTEQAARDIVAIMPQHCDSVKCGVNANCLSGPAGLLSDDEEQQTNQTLCVCQDGFLGDPYDEVHGCQQSSNGATPTTPTDSSMSSSTASAIPTTSTQKVDGCVSKNKTYEYGQEQLDDCSYKCRCETSGEFLCVPRCNYRRDEEKEIPAGCIVQKDPSDLECCEMLVCHGEPFQSGTRKDTPTVPVDGCVYNNKTYPRDKKFYDGCDHQCMCFSNGDVTCQPRCPPAANSSNSGDDCVTLPDPVDKCCTVSICGNTTLSDVMKAATIHSTIIPAMGQGRSSLTKPFSIQIAIIQPINQTAILLTIRISNAKLSELSNSNDTDTVRTEFTSDLKKWSEISHKIKDLLTQGRTNKNDEVYLIISNLKGGTEYNFRVKIGQMESEIASGFTKHDRIGGIDSSELISGESNESMDNMDMMGPLSSEDSEQSDPDSSEKLECTHKDKKYEYGAGFYDNCDAFCTCRRQGKLSCVKIECPADGLELLDDACIKWAPSKQFRKEAPNCCPEMHCVQNSSCTLNDGLVIRNFDEVPQKISGCDKRCYCNFGNVTCENLCPPMTQHPPRNLPCPPEFAIAVTMPENECCYEWICKSPPQHPHLTNQGNLSANGSKNTLLDPTKLSKNDTKTKPSTNGTQSQFPPFQHQPHPHLHDDEHDQFVPPSTGNQPTLVSLDKINPQQLQELLHHLSSLGEADRDHHHPGRPGPGPGPGPPGSGHGQGQPQGTYVQVQTPQQVRELEKDLGAKFIEQAEDGSYILLIPGEVRDEDQSYSENLGEGHGPPYSQHGGVPSGFPGGQQFPFGLGPFHQRPGIHGEHHDRSKVSNIVIHPLNESTLQIDFTVSPILVGLQGHVEVLYTKEFQHKPNPSQWERKVFQQAEDLIDNTHLQLFLMNLTPDTEYHMQIKVILMQSDIGSSSEIMRVRTPPIPIPTTPPPPEILVDPEIQLTETTSNSVKLHWRKFADMEKSLIDGVQITYKASDDKVYSTSPLLHRALGEYLLEDLLPDKEYEVNLLFIPFDSNQTTILKSEKPIFVHTSPADDQYAFDISISSGKVTETTVELGIEGIPHPEDKFVNIYQVIYQEMADPQKEQKNYFKVPKRETSKKATLTDLKPGTNYTLWVQAFLSNGKKKRSNVISIKTKDGVLPRPEMSEQGILHDPSRASSAQVPQPTSYYGALVALAIVAALSIIGVIALLMILIKKQNYAKAPINDRKSESSYDNPSFKSYDVESNGHMKPSEL